MKIAVLTSSRADFGIYLPLLRALVTDPFFDLKIIAFVNSGVSIGANCIINTSCIIEHDSIVGSNNHISTACVVNGTCIIGNNNFIGTNATLLNNLTIGNNNLIGASSVVVKNVGDGLKLFGNPATVIGKSYE